MVIALLTKRQQSLSRKAIECEIKHFEFMLNNYVFTPQERSQVQGYLANAKKQLANLPMTKQELKMHR